MFKADMIGGLEDLCKRYVDEGRSGPSMEWLRLLVKKQQTHAPVVAVAEWILREGNEAWYLMAMLMAGTSREYVVNMGDYGKAYDRLPKDTLRRVNRLDACSIRFVEAGKLQCQVDLGIDEDAIRCNVDNLHQADFLIQPIEKLASIELPGKQAVWPTCDPRKWMGAALVWQCLIAGDEAMPKQRGCKVKIKLDY